MSAFRSLIRLFAHRGIEPLVRRHTMLFAGMVARCLRQMPGNPAYDVFLSQGFHLLPVHYYSPIPVAEDVSDGYWEQETPLVGVDINEAAALAVLRDVFPRYMPEFRERFPIERTPGEAFCLINGTYMAVDAHVYYAIIRHYKPRRIVEIGSGNSTLVAAAACLKNKEEHGEAPHLAAIEPYPSDMLKQGFAGLSELIPRRVQEVDLSVFESLESGDILFIDSSHVLRAGNDVEYEYLEILPRLKPGVFVHIHDVSLPRRYPKVYFDGRLFWNEQQFLQAFLAFNSRFEVFWPGNYMHLRHADEVAAVFPEYNIMRQHYPSSEPTAFWIRGKAGA